MPQDHWSVTVTRNGEEVLTIESNCLSGRELSPEDEKAIRTAGEHLLAFVGSGEPQACFMCGKVGKCADDCPSRDMYCGC